MFFYIIVLITILILLSLFYYKFINPKIINTETFTYDYGTTFMNRAELLQYLLDNYLSYDDIAIFEKNGKKCAFLNTGPIQKQFRRFLVSKNSSNLDEISHFFNDENNNTDVLIKKSDITYDIKKTMDFDLYKDVNISGYTVSFETFSFSTDITTIIDSVINKVATDANIKAATMGSDAVNQQFIVQYKSSVSGAAVDKSFYMITSSLERDNFKAKIQSKILQTKPFVVESLTETKNETVNKPLIYNNDRHIDTADPNLYSILNFKYDPDLDVNNSDLKGYLLLNNNTDSVDGVKNYTREFNYDTLSKFNGQRVSNSYQESYNICDKNAVELSGLDFTTMTDNSANEIIEKVFPCGVILCDSISISDKELKVRAYDKLKDELIANNTNYIYSNILYSNKFLGWIKGLKESHDKILSFSQ